MSSETTHHGERCPRVSPVSLRAQQKLTLDFFLFHPSWAVYFPTSFWNHVPFEGDGRVGGEV